MADSDIIDRAGKASKLTPTEVDKNWESLCGLQETKTADYTILYTDQNKLINFNKATAVAATLDLIATILGVSGTDTDSFNITIRNIGAGLLTVTGTSGETINGESSWKIRQYDAYTFKCSDGVSGWSITNSHSQVSDTFTGTLTGCSDSPDPTGTFSYTRIHDTVTLYVPFIDGTSNTTAATITGIPAAITPTTSQVIHLVVKNAGSVQTTMNRCSIGSDSVLTLAIGNSATFTNSGLKGVFAATVSYLLS